MNEDNSFVLYLTNEVVVPSTILGTVIGFLSIMMLSIYADLSLGFEHIMVMSFVLSFVLIIVFSIIKSKQSEAISNDKK